MGAEVLILLCAAPAGWALRRLARRLAGVEYGLAWWIAAAALATTPALMASDRPVAASLALGWALLALAVIDVAVLRLPDALTLPLAAGGLLLSILLKDEPVQHAAGCAAAFVTLALLDVAYVRLRGRHGLGLGDAKLLAAAGAWLGWRPLPAVLLLACAGGVAWAAVRMLRQGRESLRRPLPFGAPLCLAIAVAWTTHLQAG